MLNKIGSSLTYSCWVWDVYDHLTESDGSEWISPSYPDFRSCLLHRAHAVPSMFLASLAHHTDRLHVHLTVQEQPLAMRTTTSLSLLPLSPPFLASSSSSWSPFLCSLLLLSLVDLHDVPEGQVGWRGLSGEKTAAHRAQLLGLFPPVLIQADRAKAVAAIQHHRVGEKLTADGALQVIFQGWRSESHFWTEKNKAGKGKARHWSKSHNRQELFHFWFPAVFLIFVASIAALFRS